ncbi:hypothetical protein [Rhizobium sp. YS-1r]|uniref:phage tail terminator protein n=1 Tax=Rhizobium sp. YS-1r TaxID=1532558 RepID=UPI00050E9A3D|nr:hypothetical protein [Rhizobium sp. YS-1r]KGE01001.1 hypothetical protein JL39_07605 [Rhizobium sp. YS-1r]
MIQDVIDRLKAMAPSLSDVSAAEDLAALAEGTAPKSGATFVIPYRELGSPNSRASGGFRQEVGVQILVAFVVRRHDDSKGGKRVSQFDTYSGEIEAALAGWATEPGNELFWLAAGKSAPLGRGNGATVYVQTWQTSRFIRKGN